MTAHPQTARAASSQTVARLDGGVATSPRRHLFPSARVIAASPVGNSPRRKLGGLFLRFGSTACGRFSPSAETLTLSAHSARPPRLRPGAAHRTAHGSCVGSLPRPAAPLTGANQHDGAAA
jgi:hypothetical protein